MAAILILLHLADIVHSIVCSLATPTFCASSVCCWSRRMQVLIFSICHTGIRVHWLAESLVHSELHSFLCYGVSKWEGPLHGNWTVELWVGGWGGRIGWAGFFNTPPGPFSGCCLPW